MFTSTPVSIRKVTFCYHRPLLHHQIWLPFCSSLPGLCKWFLPLHLVQFFPYAGQSSFFKTWLLQLKWHCFAFVSFLLKVFDMSSLLTHWGRPKSAYSVCCLIFDIWILETSMDRAMSTAFDKLRFASWRSFHRVKSHLSPVTSLSLIMTLF